MYWVDIEIKNNENEIKVNSEIGKRGKGLRRYNIGPPQNNFQNKTLIEHKRVPPHPLNFVKVSSM